MNTFLTYLLESSICLGVFYLFYIAVLQGQPSYQYNRFYLLATSFLSFIFPLLEIPLAISANTKGLADTYKAYLLLNATEVTQNSAATTTWLNWTYVGWALYMSGLIIALYLFLKQLFRLYWLIQNGKEKNIRHAKYQLIYTHGQLPASSFFRYLFWDNTHPMGFYEEQQILAHEAVHIQQKHSYDVLYMSLLKVFLWFHPLVYLYDKVLTETHEFAADAGALKSTHPRDYARLLTQRLFEGLELSLVNHFYKSRTLKRIKMMELTNKKTPWYKYALVAPLVMTVFFTFSCQPDTEEMNREAVAQSYEEVQAEIDKVMGQMDAILDKYYSDKQDYIDAAFKAKADQPNVALEILGLQGVASDTDMKKMEALSAKSQELQEKLMHLPDPDGVYAVIEHQPEPADGMEGFYRFISQNIQYPSQARRMGIEGKVFIQFVVNEYGELTDFKALKGIGAGCDEEAIRVLKNAPDWNPGTTDGKPVKVRMVMPVTFKLDHGDNNAKTQPSGSAEKSGSDKLSISGGKTLSEIVLVGQQN